MLFGLYHYVEQCPVSLPLLNVNAEASIKELAAQVKLTQTYGNDADFPIEAIYAFPIPARAAVCSFVMIKQDCTRVVGSVLEKQKAKEVYKTAVSQGRQTALMEEQTPDVFQVSVGNIPPNFKVQIELVYATELSEDEENDSIRFHLPVHIGARYGKPPTAPLSPRNPFANPFFASASSKSLFLNIAMSVESIAPITKISCPSHAVSTELGPDPTLPNFSELPFSNYARVSLSSNSPLDKDFVLTIKSAGLDAPRCVAELHRDTVAMALTFVPRFKLPDLARQEFVFLVDRSGSMANARISAARKALVVMLRSLPHKDTLFQIMSFGSMADFLWSSGSKAYNQETLEKATRHVDGMQADYGGTEIRSALKACFAARTCNRPTSVFVLTDGEAWDLNAVLAEVRAAVAAAPESAPLRVSVLGIGNAVSTAMCEGIARAGHGVCMLVGEQETSFTGKIARLLKAARTPVISNISVDWGRPLAEEVSAGELEDDFEMVEKATPLPRAKKTLNVFDETVDPVHVEETQAPPPPPVMLLPPSPVQQSPFTIRNLFPGVRLHVYAILTMKGGNVPKTVTLRGSTPEGAEIELVIPVTLSHLQNDPAAPTAVHALAARKIIQDLEDGNHALRAPLSNPDDSDLLARTVKASIVRLGTTYSISSKHTSFVAVDETTPRPPPVAVYPVSRGQDVDSTAQTDSAQLSSILASALLARCPAPPPPRAAAAPSPARDLSFYDYSALSSLVPTADRAALPSAPLVPVPTGFVASGGGHDDDDWSCSADDDSESEDDALWQKKAALFSRAPRDEPAPQSDPLETLARLQSFDGCFSAEVFAFVDLKADALQAVRALFPQGVEDVVIATVLAMVFLSAKLGPEVEQESWEGMYDKAKEYVEEALAGMGVKQSVEWLEAEVAKMLP